MTQQQVKHTISAPEFHRQTGSLIMTMVAQSIAIIL